MSYSRRGFLQSASASVGVALLDRSILNAEDLENTFKEIRANLLEMINEERARDLHNRYLDQARKLSKTISRHRTLHRSFVGAALRGRPSQKIGAKRVATEGHPYKRCRAASNKRMPAATETFKLSALPFIGMVTFSSAISNSSGVKPVDSGPSSNARGVVQSNAV